MSFEPNTPWYKKLFWTCQLLIGYWYYRIIYVIKDWFRDKWINFKCRKESKKVRKKYLNATFAPWYKKKL